MSETDPRSAPDSPPATGKEQHLLASFQRFEDGFQKNYPWLWWGTLIGPWVLTALLLAVIYLTLGGPYTLSVLGYASFAFVAAGRFVILGGAQGTLFDFGRTMTSSQICLMVTYLDVMVALVLAFHVGFLFRLPYVGPKIRELVVDGEMILCVQPWVRRLTFWGLIAFIAFPLAATGSVGGAIFGRLLGLSRWATFWGSVIGAVIGNVLMLAFSKAIDASGLENHWITKYGGLVLIVMLVIWLERRYSSMKRQYIAAQRSLASEEASPRA